ncbi:hypothetical protein, partial [Shigella flexneri]|uniref:hypothetical protein n=6 Tax=Shigella flexneri TaxID=623 RepID=UPI00131F4482
QGHRALSEHKTLSVSWSHYLSIQSNRDWLSMSIFSDYSSSSEMHNNLTIDYYLALSSTKGSGITNIISIILQQAQDYDVAKIT